MIERTIKFTLESEAIFNSAEADGNLVQMKVLADEDGFVYFHAKTLKGQMKDVAFWIYEKYKSIDLPYANQFLKDTVSLFGISKQEIEDRNLQNESLSSCEGIMKIGNIELKNEIKDFFRQLYIEDDESKYHRITRHDVIDAQTEVRTSIQIQDGVAKNNGFVTYHTVKNGLEFYCEVTIDDSGEDSTTLAETFEKIVKATRRIGAGTQRGRGCASVEICE